MRLKLSGAHKVGKNCVASLASLGFCAPTSLRSRALRPQLKRDPLGRENKLATKHPDLTCFRWFVGLKPNNYRHAELAINTLYSACVHAAPAVVRGVLGAH